LTFHNELIDKYFFEIKIWSNFAKIRPDFPDPRYLKKLKVPFN